MVGEVLLPREALAADLAAERRVVGVGAHVIRQMLLPGVLLPANGALMRSLAYEDRIAADINPFLGQLGDKRAFTCVPHVMVYVVLLPRERLLADITAVRCLAGMPGNREQSLSILSATEIRGHSTSLTSAHGFACAPSE